MYRSQEDAWQLFDALFENSLHNTSPFTLRQSSKKGGILKVGIGPHLQGQIDNLSKKVDQLLSHQVNKSFSFCAFRERMGHNIDGCPFLWILRLLLYNSILPKDSPDQWNDLCASTYNLDWRNRPNFWCRNSFETSTKNQGNAPPPRQQYGYTHPHILQASSSSTFEERILKAFKILKLWMRKHMQDMTNWYFLICKLGLTRIKF